jgi:hypothetical protein
MTEAALIVDRQGLAKKLANRPKAFIIYELLQNAWDEEGVTKVVVNAEMGAGKAVCFITVEDDAPEGFQDLTSVYTMFKDSKKAPDPTKRGRFEMGEKLVLALAIRAEVRSTKGVITINGDGRRHSRVRREKGTVFEGAFRMTREEYAELELAVQMLAVPEHIETIFNGRKLEPRIAKHTFETPLQTVRSDNHGQLHTTHRKTTVKLYEVRKGEIGHVFEMGIPVVETGDLWHYDVQQRVPVNWERNNVPPSFLRTLRVEVLNALPAEVTWRDGASAAWVTDAMDDARCSPEAVQAVVTGRFGDKAVVYDPSDPEGSKIAVTKGYTVIPGGAFSKEAWDNIRSAKAVLPAGQVTPSPRAYDPNGRPENVVTAWTPDMKRRAEFAQVLFRHLVSRECVVVIANEPKAAWSANFGPYLDREMFRLCLNYGHLGETWFALPNRAEEVLDLLLHEFCHYEVKDHLSHAMHELATKLGARLANLALSRPELFK